jgi:hypothetical protein
MMRKMTSQEWRDEQGDYIDIDIIGNSGVGLGSYDGNKIIYGDIFFRRNGKFYKVVADSTYKLKSSRNSDGSLNSNYNR